MLPSIARLLRLASFVICMIVIASFAIFAVDQTGSASKVQQEAVVAAPAPAAGSGVRGAGHEGSVHRAIDDAAGGLTSPFSAITSGSDSEWAIRGTKLLLTLVVYGFGLGYLARTLRVRT